MIQGVDGRFIGEVSSKIIEGLYSLKSINNFAKGVHLSIKKLFFKLVVNSFRGIGRLGPCVVDVLDELSTEFEHKCQLLSEIKLI